MKLNICTARLALVHSLSWALLFSLIGSPRGFVPTFKKGRAHTFCNQVNELNAKNAEQLLPMDSLSVKSKLTPEAAEFLKVLDSKNESSRTLIVAQVAPSVR